ncbi:MAG TPA: hypothetical protein VN749_05475 [Candidatus Eisenbacteria bacterium]|jgi:hypothetical protein|nr:hypothetical protein [Candidatus Eisenbacteria bacterium]
MSVNSPCLGLNRSIARWTEAHYRKETPADIIVPVALYLVGTVFRNESHRLNPMNKGPGRSRWMMSYGITSISVKPCRDAIFKS